MSKKIVQINIVCNGSTGRIMGQIQQEAIKNGWEAYSFYGRGNPANDRCYKLSSKFDTLSHLVLTRLFDIHGHGSKRATKKLIKEIDKINPDVIQLHNIHGYYLNIKILFKYLKKCNKKIVWTLHDFWAITGHCAHFTYPKCEKWKTGCSKCIRKKDYPKSSFLDGSKREYLLKKDLFTGISNMTIVAPSRWVASHIPESFLGEYEVKVINNGIDLDVFKPTSTIDIRKKYNIPSEKKIILGVSSIWDEKKGLTEFYELAKELKEEYVVVLVGLEKEQIQKLPTNIIGISRTENVEELACFYTAAEVLFNPSKEETFSLVTAEAMACGTQVIVYDNSAVKEVVEDSKVGMIIDVNKPLKENILLINEFLNKNKGEKIDRVTRYSLENMTTSYIELYNEK